MLQTPELWDGANQYIYKDGVQVAYTSNLDTAYPFAGPLYIGNNDNARDYLAGHMDDIRIYHGNPFNASPKSDLTNTIEVPTAEHVAYIPPSEVNRDWEEITITVIPYGNGIDNHIDR